VSETVIGAYPDAERAVAALAPRAAARRAAVLPRSAVDDEARLALRDAGIECLTTLDAGGPAEAAWLARELADAEGWMLADGAVAPRPPRVRGRGTWSAGTSYAWRLALSPPTVRSRGSTEPATTSPRSTCSGRAA
jgi:hypothetical protein